MAFSKDILKIKINNPYSGLFGTNFNNQRIQGGSLFG
jgi:hypothetical protein